MSEQLSVFPVDDYADRLYYNDTSTRTKRPIKRALTPEREAPQTSNVNTIQGT